MRNEKSANHKVYTKIDLYEDFESQKFVNQILKNLKISCDYTNDPNIPYMYDGMDKCIQSEYVINYIINNGWNIVGVTSRQENSIAQRTYYTYHLVKMED